MTDKLPRDAGFPDPNQPPDTVIRQILSKLNFLWPRNADAVNHSLDGFVPHFTTLPTANAQSRGRVVLHKDGGVGGRDVLKTCLESAAGVFNWISIVDGGA